MKRFAGSTVHKGFNDEAGRVVRMKEMQNVWRKMGLTWPLLRASWRTEGVRDCSHVSGWKLNGW